MGMIGNFRQSNQMCRELKNFWDKKFCPIRSFTRVQFLYSSASTKIFNSKNFPIYGILLAQNFTESRNLVFMRGQRKRALNCTN